MASTSVVFDLLANDRASAKFDRFGNTVNGTSTKMSKFTGMMKTAGKAAAYGLGAGLAIGATALVGMTKNTIEDEAAQRKLALAMRNSVDASDKQVASVEKWIAKQGVALGVTDDELRPAFQRLVESTGNVGEAQRQMGIAMDVSAGTGKSLKTVTEALMKANNGTTASLSKLGLKTKDADGNVLTLDQSLKAMSETFGGQASAKAGTLGGKMDRLKIIMDETKEAIGAKLIPVATKFADWILQKAVPAIEDFVDQMKSGKGAGGDFAAILGDIKAGAAKVWEATKKMWSILKPVLSFIVDNRAAVATFAGILLTVAAAVKIWTGAQLLLNVALTANPIGVIVVAIAGLAAGLVYAYKKSETFRTIVGGAMKAVGAVFKFMWNNVYQPIITFFIGGLAKIIEMFADLLGAMSHVPGFGWLGPLADKMHTAAEKTKGLADSIKKIPDKKTVRVNVIVNTSAITKAQNQLAGLGPEYRGRRAPGGGLFGNAGDALITSIVKGLEKGKVRLSSALNQVSAFVTKSQDKLAALLDKRAGILDSFKGMTSSIFSADLSTGEGEAPASIQRLLDFGKQMRANAEALAANVKSLTEKGLSKDLIQQLVNAGESGQAQIALLAGGSAADIAQANADNAAKQAALVAAGLTTSGALGINADIRQEQRDLKLAKAIEDRLEKLLKRQTENTYVVLKIAGKDIVASIEQYKRNLATT